MRKQEWIQQQSFIHNGLFCFYDCNCNIDKFVKKYLILVVWHYKGKYSGNKHDFDYSSYRNITIEIIKKFEDNVDRKPSILDGDCHRKEMFNGASAYIFVNGIIFCNLQRNHVSSIEHGAIASRFDIIE